MYLFVIFHYPSWLQAFFDWYMLDWLPLVSVYSSAAVTCFSGLANHTLMLMAMERLANANNSLHR